MRGNSLGGGRGSIAVIRNGGEAWVRLSWILGLRRLVFVVWFVELLDEATAVVAAGSW